MFDNMLFPLMVQLGVHNENLDNDTFILFLIVFIHFGNQFFFQFVQ